MSSVATPMKIIVVCLVSAVAMSIVGIAGGATPKPWQWTTSQAVRNVNTADISIVPSTHGDNGDVIQARCAGRGTARQGRFSSFRCSVVFRFQSATSRDVLDVLWVKVRRVGKGQPCVSLESLSAIPAECLSVTGPPRSTGPNDPTLALRKAMTIRMATGGLWSSAIACLGHGAGFYICEFENGAETGTAFVTFTTRGPIVKVTDINCLLQPERPGCHLP